MKKNNSGILNLTELEPNDSKLIDEIAEEFRKDYVDYVIKLGRENEKNIDWWMLNFVSRNTFISNLFRNVCYLVLLNRKSNENYNFKKIIVDSPALKKVIEKYKINSDIKVIYKGKSIFYIYLKRIYSYLKMILHFFIMWELGWSTRFYQSKVFLDKEITLIDTFVLEKSFDNCSYNDHYYPGLFKYLNSNEKNHIYFVPSYYSTKNYKRLFMKIRKSEQNFLLKEDYLKIVDYLFALLFFLRVRKLKILNKDFKGFDILPLIKEEILNDCVSKSTFEGLLNFRFSKRLKDKGIKIRMIVNWFENQTIDHGFNFGFRKYYPSAHLVGYQGFQLINNYLSLYPTEQERKCNIIPHEIYVVGEGYIKLAKQFCPKLIVNVAPALRQDWIWRKREPDTYKREFTILITMSLIMKESEELLRVVKEALKVLENYNYSVLVKLHPTYDIKSFISKWRKLLPENFNFTEKDFSLCIEKSDLLISCTSCTCFEALAIGKPVIVYANNFGLTQLYIPPDIKQDIWKLCYDEKEVTEAIKFYINIDYNTSNRLKKIGYGIRKKYFEKVNGKNVRKFLSL